MPYGPWMTKEVPKEICDEEKERLRNLGNQVKDECPNSGSSEENCVITYRVKF